MPVTAAGSAAPDAVLAPLRRPQVALVGTYCLLLLLEIGLLQLPLAPAARRALTDFNNLLVVLPFFAAAYCSAAIFCDSRLVRAERHGWLLIGISCLSYAFGDLAWAYYETLLRVPVPTPSLADIGYVGMYPPLVLGILLLLAQTRPAWRARLIFDSALVAFVAGVLSWHFVIHRLWQQTDLTFTGQLLAIACPMGDIAALFAAIILLKSATHNFALRASAQFLMGGIALWFLGDALYNFDALRETYRSGIWYDWLWPVGALLFTRAALIQKSRLLNAAAQNSSSQEYKSQESETHQSKAHNTESQEPETAQSTLARWLASPRELPSESTPIQSPTIETSASATPQFESQQLQQIDSPSSQMQQLLGLLWPYVGALGATVLVLAHDYGNDGLVGGATISALAVLAVLVCGRQIVTLLENQRLTLGLSTLNANLETLVARRTGQLDALHALTKAVASSLESDEVLDRALLHARTALQADAAVLWVFSNEQIKNSPAQNLPTQSTLSKNSHDGESLLRAQRVYRHRGVESHPEVLDALGAQPLNQCADAIPVRVSDRSGQRTVMCLRAPLSWQGVQLGAIGILRWDRDWGATESQILESIGLEIGAALSNARRYEAATQAADHDWVTGLFNHRALARRLDEELQRAVRHGRELSVIMMDLNNFKSYNDTFGHPAGDAVLKRAAEVILAEMRLGDVAGRYGGDEFLVILPDADYEAASLVATRLEQRVFEEGQTCQQTKNTKPISLSLGIATFPRDSNNRHELLAIADANLYAHKKSGGQHSARPIPTHKNLDSPHAFEVLEALVSAVDSKDHYTRRHAEDVAEYSLWIAHELGLSPDTMRILRLGALLHDIGKIGIPEETLLNPNRLTEQEFEIIKNHPRLGAMIVAGLPAMEDICEIVRSHHERWDGSGYPDGLAGEDIPLLARIVTIADSFGAMLTTRLHKKGRHWDAALDEMRVHAGTQFDPELVQVFLNAASAAREKTDVTH